MTFEQQIYITLLDKGLLALLLLIAGFGLNFILQSRKSRDETIRELAVARAEAFKALWSLMSQIKPSETADTSKNTVADTERKLTKWYHEDGGALYASWQTTRAVLLALDTLRNPEVSPDDVRIAVSRVRTQLKKDIGVYTSLDAWRQLPKPRPAPELPKKTTEQATDSPTG